MTPEAAFSAWLAGAVGATAYADGHVPDSATYPFVTFTLPASCWGAAATAATVDLWTRGEGDDDPAVSRRRINVSVEWMTTD